MKFSSKVICKTSKSQFKMNSSKTKCIPYKRALSAQERAHIDICVQHVCFKRARFQVSYRFIRHQIITETFKIKKFSCPSPLNDTLKLSSMNRRVSLLKVPQYSLMTSKNNFHYKAASIWNKIMLKLLVIPGS